MKISQWFGWIEYCWRGNVAMKRHNKSSSVITWLRLRPMKSAGGFTPFTKSHFRFLPVNMQISNRKLHAISRHNRLFPLVIIIITAPGGAIHRLIWQRCPLSQMGNSQIYRTGNAALWLKCRIKVLPPVIKRRRWWRHRSAALPRSR